MINQLHQRNDCIFLCDFDGTISFKDVTDTLLQNFGQVGCEALEEAWLSGAIGSKECMEGQIALLDANIEQVNTCLDQIQLDPVFATFLNMMGHFQIPVHIVSDGLDYAISRILQNNHLTELSIFANHLTLNDDGKWCLTFPYANDLCKKKSGHCKCAHLASVRQKYNQVYYVGDGSSDFCVSHHADIVFAKDKLIDYCQKQMISYHPIQNFLDIVDLLPTLRPDIFILEEQKAECLE
ncbi:MtnX-like HAD-IB family phosphatase [Neisseria sp. Ec49-e6-T10]|uniref:MtnX-like HAD-IB family phosphatase n=1 Tax=Neisseria sp. Ec49-e6-T10 TaxID=3140744 RepID=UPI003EBC1917